ncbi:Z1 domain-containing protein [Sharpea azabuensis]|uniref:Z1 domain-containing protein n=1 Tax=Sharpea azabuensis TaxID=322505 RepID=UPI0013DCFB3D|nr:Z1 domain-containing protein [Sharpea azabuensis]
MKDYSLPKYDDCRNLIMKLRSKGVSWEELRYARKGSLEGLNDYLAVKADEEFWEIDADDYMHIYELLKSKEEDIKVMHERGRDSVILSEGEGNVIDVPTSPDSSWQIYRKKLEGKGFKNDSIDSIERTTKGILQRLNGDTTSSGPIKGLVIGNVQSGKTANMAALMAMAADYGWNMFIVLSGVIESLREQTQTRLFEDLHSNNGTNHWILLEHLSKKSPKGQRAQDCDFQEGSLNHIKYFTVSLKVKSRLKDLMQWLQEDQNKQKQMKILVIDDEADQAGINTADITTEERKAINACIENLVNEKTYNSKDCPVKYKAMNYIGYTATPYANVLNDPKKTSLYPKDFIVALNVSNEYFGPQQIFGITSGVSSDSYEGLSIINEITENDHEQIKHIQKGEESEIPESLKSAIAWFICSTAVMRYWNIRKPVSMLVHTSQKTRDHQHIADAIDEWFTPINYDEIIALCEDVYQEQTENFTKGILRDEYRDYGIPNDEINDYPDYREIEKEISHIVNLNLNKIRLNENEELKYGEGIHLCIDNCMNNGINEENEHVRLVYPSRQNMPDKAPAFLVIGGQTLSRGLTLEGLLCTYFLRTTKQADTLMQMGRWFGYRKGYELLPRIWITKKTRQKFEFLSDLDQELRNEINLMEINGISPSECGPRIMNTPSVNTIRITSPNRMQSAETAKYDFSGANSQTQVFSTDEETLKSNYSNALSFIQSLGMPDEKGDYLISSNIVWRDVDNDTVECFIRKYRFNKRQYIFEHVGDLFDWCGENINKGNLKNWNVVLHNPNENKNVKFPIESFDGFEIVRSEISPYEKDTVRVGALRDPGDLVCDIDLSSLSTENRNRIVDRIQGYKKTYSSAKVDEIREMAGLGAVPQLIIYCIDKKSKAKSTSSKRRSLNLDTDMIGLSIRIPGGKKGKDYVTYITIKMPERENIMGDIGEIE